MLQSDDDDRDLRSRGGRRLRDDRSEAEKLLDVGIRFEGLRALYDGLQKSGLRRELKPGCVVIARADIPGDSIITSQSYELTSVYYQGAPRGGVRIQQRVQTHRENPSVDGASVDFVITNIMEFVYKSGIIQPLQSIAAGIAIF